MIWPVIVAVGVGSFAFRVAPLLLLNRQRLAQLRGLLLDRLHR